MCSRPRMVVSFDRGTLLIEPGAASGPPLRLPPYVLWDSRVRRWRAPAFRLAALRDWLEGRGVPWRCGSSRPRGFELGPGLGEDGPVLRPYQAEAHRAWIAAGRRGVVVLPTGSGKTRLALHAMHTLWLPAIVLVPTRQLLWQWRTAISEHLPGPIGVLGDGEREVQPITVATYESAHRQMDRFGDHFDLLVVDEAHHMASSELREAVQMTTAPLRLGLTATPPLDDGVVRSTRALLGPVCYALPLARLTGKYLADFEIQIIPLALALDEKAEYERCRARFIGRLQAFFDENPRAGWVDFARSSWGSEEGREAFGALRRSREIVALSSAKLAALDVLLETHHEEPKLVFTADNRSAYEVSRRFLVPAITCEIERRERELILARFREGVYRTLVSAKVLNEGLDVPAASVAIIAGGSSDPREHAQRIGRVLRPIPGKKAVVYELVLAGTREWRASERRGLRALEAAPPL
ncbi:MAG: DEAD/DEAH box helicase [Planctomycetes bacterium]|nr:DEAD/DEAH box helicase [Planctomycetota bacterium]